MPSDAMVDAKRSIRKAAETIMHDLGKGDAVLIKGRDNQRLERIALILAGRQVRCDIDFCNATGLRCSVCPMLEKGWDKATFIR